MNTVTQLWEADNNLQDNPEIGRVGRVLNTRELVALLNYILVNRIREHHIDILTVQHAARRYPN